VSEKKGSKEAQPTERQIRVKLHTDNLKSSYANFCNVTSTREEVVVNFGINSDWDRSRGEIGIDLTNRLILSPFAAKRLHMMLTSLLEGYESRYGKINIEPVAAQNTTATKQ